MITSMVPFVFGIFSEFSIVGWSAAVWAGREVVFTSGPQDERKEETSTDTEQFLSYIFCMYSIYIENYL